MRRSAERLDSRPPVAGPKVTPSYHGRPRDQACRLTALTRAIGGVALDPAPDISKNPSANLSCEWIGNASGARPGGGDPGLLRDGTRACVALGRANHVAVVDVKTRTVEDYILVGRRAWGLALTRDEKLLYVANGLSDDISIIDVDRLKVLKSVPVGQVPYGILIDD